MTLEFFTLKCSIHTRCVCVIYKVYYSYWHIRPFDVCITFLSAVMMLALCYHNVLKIFFNWRVIALHYCVSFCRMSTWSSIGLHMPPPPGPPHHLPPHPTALDCHSALRLSALCQTLALAVCFTYGAVYASVLPFQFIPPPPSPTVSTGLFSVSASPLFPCR